MAILTRRGVIGIAAAGTTAASAVTARAQIPSRSVETEALRLRAEAIHPRGPEAAADQDWQARWRALTADADALSDGEYFLRTRQALGWFKDGHTTLLPFEFTGGVPAQLAQGSLALNLPIGVQAFHDGAYVTRAAGEGEALLGARITRVGSADIAALMRAWATDFPGNDAWARRWAGTMFRPAFLQALGAVNDPGAPVRIEGRLERRHVHAVLTPRIDGESALRPLARTKTQVELWSEEAGESSGGNYVRRAGDAIFISCDDLGADAQAFRAFTHACFEAMDDPSPRRLVVDLRRNGGGDNYLFEPLRKHIERSRFNRPGALYVMVSPQTFSAAQNAANRLERETFAIFVGEPTGGAPNHFGDGQVGEGAVTGIVSLISSLPWFDSYPQDRRIWIMPDLPSPQSFADWRNGDDPALHAALNHTSDAPADDWSEARVFYFRRPSQAADWRPFWRQS